MSASSEQRMRVRYTSQCKGRMRCSTQIGLLLGAWLLVGALPASGAVQKKPANAAVPRAVAAKTEQKPQPTPSLEEIEAKVAESRETLRVRLEAELAAFQSAGPISARTDACPSPSDGPTARARALTELDKEQKGIQRWTGIVAPYDSDKKYSLSRILNPNCYNPSTFCPEFNELCYWARLKALRFTYFSEEGRPQRERINEELLDIHSPVTVRGASSSAKEATLTASQRETLSMAREYILLEAAAEKLRKEAATRDAMIGVQKLDASDLFFLDAKTIAKVNLTEDGHPRLYKWNLDPKGAWTPSKPAIFQTKVPTSWGENFSRLDGVIYSCSFGRRQHAVVLDLEKGVTKFSQGFDFYLNGIKPSPSGNMVAISGESGSSFGVEPTRVFLLASAPDWKPRAIDLGFRRGIESYAFITEDSIEVFARSDAEDVVLRRTLSRGMNGWVLGEIEETARPKKVRPRNQVLFNNGKYRFELARMPGISGDVPVLIEIATGKTTAFKAVPVQTNFNLYCSDIAPDGRHVILTGPERSAWIIDVEANGRVVE